MPKDTHLTNRQKQSVALKEAHGKAIVLAIGIDKYDENVGFPPLKTCSNDAAHVRDAFLDVHQLNADPSRVYLLSSKTAAWPSKGEIIKAINKLVSVSQESDRLILYFSGHGHRLKDKNGNEQFFIAPQDAWDCDDAEALLDFDKIRELINRAESKQKIVILDACFSGPVAEGRKFLPAKFSKKFLAEYMKKTKGFAVISSSSKDAVSFTQSPNPKLSLFTFHLIKALRGTPEALDDSFLTLNSLYEYVSVKVNRDAKSYQLEQSPGIHVQSSKALILGNFSASIISPEQLDLEGYPISNLMFVDQEYLDVTAVLTKIFRWAAYSEEYIEDKVNQNLDDYLEEDFGKKASKLRNLLSFSPDDVFVDDKCIMFPGGSYCGEYKADGKKKGKIVYSLIFEDDWFGKPDKIPQITNVLDMRPSKIYLKLKKSLDPLSLIPGLEAKGWNIMSHLAHKIEASSKGYKLIVEDNSLIFTGFAPSEILGSKSDKTKASIAISVLGLLK